MAPDPRKVRLVELLLAKADRTNFPEEAKTFRRRAEELMAKYGIERGTLRPVGPAMSTGWSGMSGSAANYVYADGQFAGMVVAVTGSASGRTDGGYIRLIIQFG